MKPVPPREDVQISEQEYLNRLQGLLPREVFSDGTLTISCDVIERACGMVEEISVHSLKELLPFSQTDLICELNDSFRNLLVLGQFLGICFSVTQGDE